MPGMCTAMPSLHINTRLDLFLLFSTAKLVPLASLAWKQSDTVRIKHPVASYACLSSRSWWCLQVTVWDFTSGHCTPELNQRLLFVSGSTEESCGRFEIFMQRHSWWKGAFFSCPCFLLRKCRRELQGWNKSSLGTLLKWVRVCEPHIPKRTCRHIFDRHKRMHAHTR